MIGRIVVGVADASVVDGAPDAADETGDAVVGDAYADTGYGLGCVDTPDWLKSRKHCLQDLYPL